LQEIKDLQKIIGYQMKNEGLLLMAITHSSYGNQNKKADYEVLEFLGDSVLSVIIADFLAANFADRGEGYLTKVRSSIVCKASLSSIARELDLHEYIKAIDTKDPRPIKENDSMLEDVFEAIVGAIYLDGGIDSAKNFIMDKLSSIIKLSLAGEINRDYKSALQEKLQAKGETNIEYITASAVGEPHLMNFEVELYIEGKKVSSGMGRSKKAAQQEAAKKYLEEAGN
jgi:ribonuclease-3